MGSYDNRRREVLNAYQAMMPRLQSTESLRLGGQLSPLYDVRDSALTALLEIARADGSELLAGDWKEKSAYAAERFVAPMSHLLDGLSDPGREVSLWVEAQATFEAQFLRQLDAIGVVRARDGLVRLETLLTGLVKDLQLKWDRMTSSAKDLDALEQDAARKMGDILKTAASNGGDKWSRYGAATNQLAAALSKVPGMVSQALVGKARDLGWPDALAAAVPSLSSISGSYRETGRRLGMDDKALAAIDPEKLRDSVARVVVDTLDSAVRSQTDAAVDALIAFYKEVLPVSAGTLYEQFSNYQRNLPNQAVVAQSVGRTRRDVDDFLKENGIDAARAIFDWVDAALSRWSSAVPTDGMKSDASIWATDVRAALKARYDRISNAFAAFANANKGKFIGSPAKEVENQIIYTDSWADRTQGLIGIGMDTRLKDWRSGLSTVSDAVTSASAQAFSALDRLPSDINDYARRAANSYWDKARDRFKQETDNALSALNSGTDKVQGSALEQALNRRQLRDTLFA